MKSKCPNPRCGSKEMKKIVEYKNGSDNIDNLGHYHLECNQCGWNFNLWDSPVEAIKKSFGDNWKLYI